MCTNLAFYLEENIFNHVMFPNKVWPLSVLFFCYQNLIVCSFWALNLITIMIAEVNAKKKSMTEAKAIDMNIY